MGAICSAFLHDPDAAWLVLACDLPLLDRTTIETLVNARRPNKVATALRSPEQKWPEPLVAIYEPRAYPRLLQFLSLGYSCPRKLLINSEVEVITLADAAPVTNANTPADREAVLQRLNGE
jgi:molybdopterin-guanine dinucleotide biosynthesis protein A